MHGRQQLQMVDLLSLHGYAEQRLHVAGDLRQAVVAGCRTARLVDHRRQVRGDFMQALLQHPAIAGAAVVGVADERWGQSVAAAIVVRKGQDARDLDAWLRERLAGYKVPRQVRVVDTLPATASGKVQRRLVRAWFELGGA